MTTRATRQFGVDRAEDVQRWVAAAVSALTPGAPPALAVAAGQCVASLQTQAASVQVDVRLEAELLEVRIGGLLPEGALETQSYWWTPAR